MALVAENGTPIQRRRSKDGLNSPSDVRYSDVANYVGKSLAGARGPSTTRSKSVPNLFKPQDTVSSLSPSGRHAASPRDDLPPILSINGSRTELLRSQLGWLRAEQRAEKEQLHKLEGGLSDSLLVEKKLQRKAAKQREMRDFHQQRTFEVERKISLLRQEIHGRESRPKPGSLSQTAPNPSTSSASLPSPVASPTVALSRENKAATHSELDKTRRSKSLNQCDTTAAAEAPAASTQVTRAGSTMHSEGRKPDGQNWSRSASTFLSSQAGINAGELSTSSPKLPVPRTILKRTHTFGGSSLYIDTDDQEELSSVPRHQNSVESAATADVGELLSQTRNRQPQPGSRRKSPSRSSKTLTQQGSILSFTSTSNVNNPEEARENVRQELIRVAGGEHEAFRSIDINGSGHLSSMKFADGVTRLGIQWSELTGLRRPRELFSLFDQDKDGVITFEELFPCPAPRKAREISTPEFVGHWIRSNKDFEGIEKSPLRCSKWQPDDSNQKLDSLLQQSKVRDDVSAKKQWMSSTIRRLKSRGKSDARCREIVALHLPRGTGPKDKEDVPIFSKSEARACQKKYIDEYMGPVKRIQKVVGDLKEQKRDLHQVKESLFMCTEAKRMKQLHEEHRKDVAASIMGDAGSLGGVLGKFRDPLIDGEKQINVKTLSQMAEENGMDAEIVSDLFRDFVTFADANELLGPDGFSRFLQTICPGRTLSHSDVTAWWGQLLPGGASKDDTEPSNRKSRVPFEDFVHWYATSEARSM